MWNIFPTFVWIPLGSFKSSNSGIITVAKNAEKPQTQELKSGRESSPLPYQNQQNVPSFVGFNPLASYVAMPYGVC